jgi:hypothetical protein
MEGDVMDLIEEMDLEISGVKHDFLHNLQEAHDSINSKVKGKNWTKSITTNFGKVAKIHGLVG